jgi:hypothetical protein
MFETATPIWSIKIEPLELAPPARCEPQANSFPLQKRRLASIVETLPACREFPRNVGE